MTRTTVRGCCPLDCPDTCSWLIDLEDGRPVRMRGDREHPFTRGNLCGKVNRYLDALHDPERLLRPLVRAGAKGEGRHVEAPWDEAVGRIAEGLRTAIDRHGPESVLPYYFAGTIGQVQAWTLGPRLFAHLGATRLRTTICTAATQAALRATYGSGVGPDPEDLVHARLVLLWGSNPLNANLHLWRFVEEARRRGAHVVTIDPIRTDTAARSDEHVALLPGTDAALALGLMRHLLDVGAVDRAWLDAHTEGWPELEERLAGWTVDDAARICGLEAAQVRALGDRLATTRPTFIRLGLGMQRHAGAGAAVRAVLALPCLTGDFRHVGGGAVSLFDGFTEEALRDDLVRPAGMPVPRARSLNMSRLGEALTGALDPPVAAMVVWSSNPAASAPDGRRVRAGLARDDLFLAVIEQRRTDTTDYADVVLPATMQPEHLDLVIPYGQGYLAWNEPAVAPPGEARTTTDAFRAIARALGLDHPRLFDTDEEIVRHLLDTDVARARGLTVEALRERGWARGAAWQPGVAPFAEGGFPTPSGRVRLLAPELAARGADPLVGFTPPAEVLDEERAASYPLVLLAPAGRFFLNSTFGSLPWHLRMQGGPAVHLHPDDAAARGLAAGDRARVWNERGAFHAHVVVDDAARPGLAFTYKVPWRRLAADGENMNAVTTERDADLGGSPTFHDCRVEVGAA